ncbi:MAG TPA: hypothetical protein VMW42_11430 [Desulfatiglandales bacterium]|nr:hypothetical protein [Desulfatiglandales bacterium]
MPEAEEVDVTIDPADLRIDVLDPQAQGAKALMLPILPSESHAFPPERWSLVRMKNPSTKIRQKQ